MLPVTVCHILRTEDATYMPHRCAHSVLQQISSHLWREKKNVKSKESPFSSRNYTSLQNPILSQELYFPQKKYKLENMQQPVLAQELYFPKRKFRLENCTNQQQKTVSINSSYHRQFKVINSAKIETAMNCKRMFLVLKGFQNEFLIGIFP